MIGTLDALLPIRTVGNGAPLFCVHPISGSPYVYRVLAQSLGTDQPIYAFEAPGFDDGRTPLTTIPALSAEYLRILEVAGQSGPFSLLGWSMGGAVAFDMAQRLAFSKGHVPTVIVIDTAVPKRMELPPRKAMLRRFVHDIIWVSGMSPSTCQAKVDAAFARCCDDAPPAMVLEEVERADVFPPEIDAEFLEDRYRVFRAHIEALFGYQATGTYPGRVVTINATGTPPEYMGWTDVASDIEEHVVDGDHYSIWTGDGLRTMSGILERCLAPAEHQLLSERS